MKTFYLAAALFLIAGAAATPFHATGLGETTGLAGTGGAPDWLTQTGLYGNAATLEVDAQNRLFSPQYPLWTDGAAKRRWIRLPAGSRIDVGDVDRWEFPTGTRIWKEFSFGGRKVETRMLWKTASGRWGFASYAWNEAQTDASLVPDSGLPDAVEIAPGKRHSIPSIAECRSCHDSSRTEILGFNALQLSTDRDPNALHAEALTPGMVTLRTLVDEDLMFPRRSELVAAPPRIAARTAEERTALGYLRTNCGSCHNAESSIASLGLFLKGRDNVAVESTVGRRGHWVVPSAQDESMIVHPGRPEWSALLHRMKSRRPSSQMPPLGTVVQDQKAVDLMTRWIQSTAKP